MNLATYGTLAMELALGVLVWNRRARPWVLAMGFAMHVSIAYSIRVGFFSLAMFTLYLAFVPPGWAETQLLRLRDRMAASERLPRRLKPEPGLWNGARVGLTLLRGGSLAGMPGGDSEDGSSEGARALTKVLLVDDHHLFRGARKSILKESNRVEVVGEASTGEAALPLVERRRRRCRDHGPQHAGHLGR